MARFWTLALFLLVHALVACDSVSTSASNPLVGTYRETNRIECGTGVELTPTDPIGEVVFRADGTFAVTFDPFERYVDYWGEYSFDVASGAIALTVTGGNYVPPDLDDTGTFAVDSGTLVLDDLWLGARATPTGPTVTPACGHRLAR